MRRCLCWIQLDEVNNPVRMFRPARKHNCINERNANGPAEIARKIEQAAGVSNMLAWNEAESKADGWQNAERHECTAHNLRPEHFIIARAYGLKAAHQKPNCKGNEANG